MHIPLRYLRSQRRAEWYLHTNLCNKTVIPDFVRPAVTCGLRIVDNLKGQLGLKVPHELGDYRFVA